jgi:very-short-patch-repair endonuclease
MKKLDENEEYVVCKICGHKGKRLFGSHFKDHGITSAEYKAKYPGEKIQTDSDKKNTSINSGKHMKEDKYRKLFSDMQKGENNRNSKSKTTEEQRKQRSPFSKDFVKYKDLENKEEAVSSFVKDALKDRVLPSNIEYWTARGYTLEEAKDLVKESQTKFSLEICMEKYGEEKGKEIWKERQVNWQKHLNENGNLKNGYSKVSQDLFDKVVEGYTEEDLVDVKYALCNGEFSMINTAGGWYSYDFVDLKRKKVIEFNGDVFHANPEKFDADDKFHPFLKENGPTAKEMWMLDEKKRLVIESKGFDVMVVWEREYRKDTDGVVKRCKDFLMG